jgi:hypothetical protein
MPWAVLKAKPVTEFEVVPDNGRKYLVTFHGDKSYLPLHLYNFLLRQGKIVPCEDAAPPVQFERLGNVHGKPVSPFSEYVREVTS